MAKSTYKMNLCDEKLVISGISGHFPMSQTMNQFADNLLNGVDMVTVDDERWPPELWNLPQRSGKIGGLDKFDSQFFGVHGKQADSMDPGVRQLLELTYEAILDAGVCPQNLRGHNIGVYVGLFTAETEEGLANDITNAQGYIAQGCYRAIFANRISYTFDFKGPSIAIDTACSSALTALEQAVLAIRTGQCDSAIVGGVNLCLRPVSTLQFARLSLLCPDGKCKFFDAEANGYVRSETNSVVFIQKVTQAKRIYAEIVNAKINTDGYKPEGLSFPSSDMQRCLIEKTYQECDLDPLQVNYIEAHGTGTKAGDPQELNAIASIFCGKRDGPLLVGGVKSNVGHAEAASGMCSIAKVLIAFEKQIIPANLHLKTINPNIKPLVDGSIKPVIQNTPFPGGYVGVNSFGFGGSNAHVILKSHDKEPTGESYSVVPETYPRLVTMCGRTGDAVTSVLNFIIDNPSQVTRDFLALVNDISKIDTASGMKTRGHTLLGSSSADIKISEVQEKRPIWCIFSGFGSQWPQMGKQMMNVPIFAETINYFASVLREFDIDLIRLLTFDAKEIMKSALNGFITISAIQGALYQCLESLGLQVDGMIGHSMGETTCALADGCLDKRQFILAAYWRGKSVQLAGIKGGLMAAVGLSIDECKTRLPSDILVACHNSEDSVTICGPEISVKLLVKKLSADGVFAREVASCGMAAHSHYVSEAGPFLLLELKKVISSPKKRSDKWISTSVAQSDWSKSDAQYASPEYIVRNFNVPVLLADGLKHIPKHAIVIEVSPHSLMQSIIKKSVGPDASYVSLMNRNSEDQLFHFFSALGSLYNLGINLNLEILYPEVNYPVARGTASISSLIKWDHSHSWLVAKYPHYFNPSKLADDVTTSISLENSDDAYLCDHKIDGRVLLPATGYLMLAWQAFAKVNNKLWHTIPVHFTNVHLHRACILPKTGTISLLTQIVSSTGHFTISESGTLVASGYVARLSSMMQSTIHHSTQQPTLSKQNIYKELRTRGYDYGPSFRSIEESTCDGSLATVKWTGKWIAFADAMLQQSLLATSSRKLLLPVKIGSVKCDPQVLLSLANDSSVQSTFDPILNEITADGIEIKGLEVSQASRREIHSTHEKYTFIPHNESNVRCEQIQQYINLCSKAAAVLLRRGRDDSPAVTMISDGNEMKCIADIYATAQQSDRVLLKCLCELLIHFEVNEDNLTECITQVQQKYRDELKKDALQQPPIDQRLLRPLIDLVIENCHDKSLKIVECNSSGTFLYPSIANFASWKQKSLDYSLIRVNDQATDLKDATIIDYDDSKELNLKQQHLALYYISNDTTEQQDKLFDEMVASVKIGGFLLIGGRDSFTQVEKIICNPIDERQKLDSLMEKTAKSFVVVARKVDCVGRSLVLLRRIETNPPVDKNKITVIGINNRNFEWIEQVKSALQDRESHPEAGNIWLVNTDAIVSGIIGLVTCLRREPGGEKIRCLFDKSRKVIDRVDSSSIDEDILKSDLAINVLDENRILGSYFHLDIDLPSTNITTNHACLTAVTKGDDLSLRWIESSNKFWSSESARVTGQELIHVYNAAINLKDTLQATGKWTHNSSSDIPPLGVEFSGRRSNGQRVMGMIANSAIATTCLVDGSDLQWPVPDHWSLEDASTVVLAYTSAYYSLVVRGCLQSRESVLIHSACQDIGLAAICICLSMNCRVFATLSSESQREYLLEKFPSLQHDDIALSQDKSFERNVLLATDGRGIDIVLSSSPVDQLETSMRTIAKNGRLVMIGTHDPDVKDANHLKNISIHSIELDFLVHSSADDSVTCHLHRKLVKDLMTQGISNGTVKPLPRTVFTPTEVTNAFRSKLSGEVMGKVLIQMRHDEDDRTHAPEPMQMSASPRTHFDRSKCHMIIGGLGGFGLELARWMVSRGARKLIITSRSGVRDSYQELCLSNLRKIGAQVHVSTAQLTDLSATHQLIDDAQQFGPIGSIFNLALALRDGLFMNQSIASFEETTHSKATITQLLDQVSRVKCPELDHFVVFSSISCGYGNAGQSNYGLANSVMERICEERRKCNSPALAIQWGPIGDVGIIAEMSSDATLLGTSPQRINSCLQALDRLMTGPETIVSSVVRAPRDSNSGISSRASSDQLVSTIGNILGVSDASSLAPSTTLHELGMDSLMAVEIRQTLEREYDSKVSMVELRSLNFGQIAAISKSKNSQETTKPLMSSVDKFIDRIDFSVPTETIQKLNHVKEGKPIFVLPPIEGKFSRLECLADQVNRPLIGINWTKQFESFTTVEEAAVYCKRIIQSTEPDADTHDVLAYSFGTVVAVELSLICTVNNLILLDGSPHQARCMAESIRNSFDKSLPHSPKSDHVKFLILFLSQYVADDMEELYSELMSIDDEEERNAAAAEIISKRHGSEFTMEELRFASKTFHHKSLMVLNYRTSGKTNSRVILLRAEKPLWSSASVDSEYNLSNVTNSPVTVNIYSGSHTSFIELNRNSLVSVINSLA